VAQRRVRIGVGVQREAVRDQRPETEATGAEQAIPDRRGWPALHRAHVLQAPDGCDYDFLRVTAADQLPFTEPVIGRS
jgi:hypothetical protein